MRVSIDLETDGHEYRVELESDQSIRRHELIQMAASQIDLMANVTDHHKAARAAKLDEVIQRFAPAAQEQ